MDRARQMDIDRFATAAMMGIVQKTGLTFDANVVAEESFKLAEAMVAEREKRYTSRARGVK